MTQNEALEILKSGYNVYLTGAAGSGKTYLVNRYVEFLKKKKIGVAVTASTGIAATHIGGITIHSWAGIGIKRSLSDGEIRKITANRRLAGRFARTGVLIIDEVSMLDAGRLDLVDRVIRATRQNDLPFGGMQVVLSGDFFQLPPVAAENEPPPEFAYRSAAWRGSNLKICYLHEQHRQGDRILFGVLNAIRNAEVNEGMINVLRGRMNAAPAPGGAAKLYAHNVDVDAENARELTKIPGEERRYEMETSGVSQVLKSLKSGCLAPETFIVKKGAAVMFIKNNVEKGYVNGTLGRVIGFSEEGWPVVGTSGGREVIASPEEWSVEENSKTLARISQVPLRLAWAITIHKSQGITLDAAKIDLSNAFEKGMGYVALSRVRSLGGMELLGFNEVALQVHPEILAFDGELKKLSEEAAREMRERDVRENKKIPVSNPSKTYSVEEIRGSHPAAYRKWSAGEEETLIAGFRGGVSVKAIAERLGRKQGAIRSRLLKLGVMK